MATEAAKGSRGSDPRLLGLTMGRLLDRTFGVRPRASRIVHALGLDQIHNIIAQQDRQSKRLDQAWTASLPARSNCANRSLAGTTVPGHFAQTDPVLGHLNGRRPDTAIASVEV